MKWIKGLQAIMYIAGAIETAVIALSNYIKNRKQNKHGHE